MDLNQTQKRAKQVNLTLISKLFEKELLKNKSEIITFVKERWKRGKKPDGSIIGEYASFAYQQEKIRQNPLAGGNVDLIRTGALVGDLDVFSISNDNFSIFSKDEKALNIADKYGIEVYGLTKEEEKIVINLVLSRINVRIIDFILTGKPL